ncbi:MAG: hypothetical protein PUD17_06810 [Treponema sp.]|uniref:PulJ/GspJ family protein n=1 Tax=Treponema sp. TaxID=166 RepID=UPI00298E839D|nr:hypothetical protein [Treponema sp.]MDD5811795.1 hypothetical protein [Treponema sp.]
MKLTEVIVAVAIFLIACTVFSASLINVMRGVDRSEAFSKNAVALLDTDTIIRKEIKKINVPYWKSFDSEFKKEKILLEESLKNIGKDKGFKVESVSSVYDRKRRSEGIKIEWKIYGRKYVCQEFIRQRIVNEE